MSDPIFIYTDGSCNPEHGIGAWAVTLYICKQKITLSGIEDQTTHQRMELTAVIKAFQYLAQEKLTGWELRVFTDSQYVVGIPDRMVKLKTSSFVSKRNLPLHNADLLQMLIEQIEKLNPYFIKVKAHQHDVQNSNQEVDRLSRKLVREAVDTLKLK